MGRHKYGDNAPTKQNNMILTLIGIVSIMAVWWGVPLNHPEGEECMESGDTVFLMVCFYHLPNIYIDEKNDEDWIY